MWSICPGAIRTSVHQWAAPQVRYPMWPSTMIRRDGALDTGQGAAAPMSAESDGDVSVPAGAARPTPGCFGGDQARNDSSVTSGRCAAPRRAVAARTAATRAVMPQTT